MSERQGNGLQAYIPIVTKEFVPWAQTPISKPYRYPCTYRIIPEQLWTDTYPGLPQEESSYSIPLGTWNFKWNLKLDSQNWEYWYMKKLQVRAQKLEQFFEARMWMRLDSKSLYEAGALISSVASIGNHTWGNPSHMKSKRFCMYLEPETKDINPLVAVVISDWGQWRHEEIEDLGETLLWLGLYRRRMVTTIRWTQSWKWKRNDFWMKLAAFLKLREGLAKWFFIHIGSASSIGVAISISSVTCNCV